MRALRSTRLVALLLAPAVAWAFPPVPSGQTIPGPGAAAPQVALTSSVFLVACTQIEAQQGTDVWVFNPGNWSFYYVLSNSHPTNPNAAPPTPAGHSYNPVGPVRDGNYPQSDCGGSVGPAAKKLYWQDWACWPNTSKVPGGQCVTNAPICPIGSHATLVGMDCQCLDPMYPVEDVAGRRCLIDPCTALNCDDGRACTVDRCDRDAGACTNTVEDLGTCTCAGGTPPNITASAGTQIGLPSIACQGVGGTLSANLNLSANGSYQTATCANLCTSQASLTATAQLSATLCSKDQLTVTASGTGTVSRVHAPTCIAASCGRDCGPGYCGTNTFAQAVSVQQTRFAGVDVTKRIPGGARAAFKCGGTLTAAGSVNSTTSEQEAVGTAPPCPDCVDRVMTLSAQASGDLTCALKLGPELGNTEFGCRDCLAADVQMTGTVGLKTGSCGNTACSGLLSRFNARGSVPSTKARFLWWSVRVACNAEVRGCGEANSCGACTCGGGTCGELKTDVSCTVCDKDSLLEPCY